jgi:hypothetical protein
MARPKRKQLKFDEESVNKLLQEIYDESHNIKAKITRLFNKWETQVKETGEVAAVGGEIVKLIAAEAKNQDQKIMILKYLKEVVFEKNREGGALQGGTASGDDEGKEMSAERRNELLSFVEEHANKTGDKKSE